MLSSITGQNNGSSALAGFQSSSPVSWRSPSSANQSAANQSAANSASRTNQTPPFDSMMASFLQIHGFTNGTAGSTLSSGVSDDAQFVSNQTTGGIPSLPNQQSLLTILSNRGASSTAETSTGASSTSTASTAVDALNAMMTKGLKAVANDVEPNAMNTIQPSAGTTAASGNTAASSGSTAQTTLPPWASGWFNVGASTESATTGWADAFGQQYASSLNQQYAQAASAYSATSSSSQTRPVTSVTA